MYYDMYKQWYIPIVIDCTYEFRWNCQDGNDEQSGYNEMEWSDMMDIAGHDGLMCNADQCRSMCDQISDIDPKYFSIKKHWEVLIGLDQHRSLLRSIGINA